MPDVSLVAALVATVLGFALGALWYGPLFGRAWTAAVAPRATETRRHGEEASLRASVPQRPAAANVYGTTFVLGFITSYAFGLYLGPDPGRAFALVAGASAGVFLVAASLATNYLFEGRQAVLIAINGGYHAVRFTLIGLTFGLLG